MLCKTCGTLTLASYCCAERRSDAGTEDLQKELKSVQKALKVAYREAAKAESAFNKADLAKDKAEAILAKAKTPTAKTKAKDRVKRSVANIDDILVDLSAANGEVARLEGDEQKLERAIAGAGKEAKRLEAQYTKLIAAYNRTKSSLDNPLEIDREVQKLIASDADQKAIDKLRKKRAEISAKLRKAGEAKENFRKKHNLSWRSR
jgi:hypothetical protein